MLGSGAVLSSSRPIVASLHHSSHRTLKLSIRNWEASTSQSLLLGNGQFHIQKWPLYYCYQQANLTGTLSVTNLRPAYTITPLLFLSSLVILRIYLKTITTNRRYHHTASTSSSHNICIYRNLLSSQPIDQNSQPAAYKSPTTLPPLLADHPTRSGPRRTLPK